MGECEVPWRSSTASYTSCWPDAGLRANLLLRSRVRIPGRVTPFWQMLIILASLYSQTDLILPTPNGESPNGVHAVKDYVSYVGGFRIGWVLPDHPILHLQAVSSSLEYDCFLYFAKVTSGPKFDFALVNDLGGTGNSH